MPLLIHTWHGVRAGSLTVWGAVLGMLLAAALVVIGAATVIGWLA